MSDGLRVLPFTIRLVDASYWDRPRCVACGAYEGHTMYCITTMLLTTHSSSPRGPQA